MNFQNYKSSGCFDEMFDASGKVKPHYQRLYNKLREISPEELENRRASIDSAFLQQGVTFTVYHDEQGTERIFPFDIVPRIIPNNEWRRIEEGLTQRVTALNLFLQDIYHDQKILRDGIIPRHLVSSAEQFRPALMGTSPPGNIFIHVSGCDLIRDKDGRYLVLEDNLRCPSGVSYMLESRQVLKRLFPRLFPSSEVEPIRHYPDFLFKTLRNLVSNNSAHPNIALLTPGPLNSAYFEHCFLAMNMGIELVEGRDLFVRDKRLYMRTTKGPQKVDVLYRRVNDDFIDPTVFRKDSLLGVPHLISAYQAGNVALANAVGTGVADDKTIYRYVPRIIKYYLNSQPILPNVETYLPTIDSEYNYILDNLDKLVIKTSNESGGYGMLVGPHASKQQLEDFRQRIKSDPRNFVAQPTIDLSQHPTWTGTGFEARHVDLRPFVLYADKIRIVPGGLTRVALQEGSLVVNSSQGGGSKDTWVMRNPT